MSRQVNIIKRRKTKAFVTLENALVRDRRLTLDEHGMLHYLLSLPDDWEVSRTNCAKFWDIGRDKAARIFRKLRQCGWAQVERVHADDGTFLGVRWIITDEPGAEVPEAVLDREMGDETDAAGPAIAPEIGANHDTENPAHGLPGVRVTRDTENAGHGLYRDSTKTELEEKRALQKHDVGGDARASGGNLFTEGSKALASVFWKALGFETPLQIPPEFAGIDYRATMWEREGWPPDMIEAETRKFAADRPFKPISYFEKVFATAFAKRQAPLPVVKVREAEQLTVTRHGRPGHQGQGNIIQAADRLVDTLRRFDDDGTRPGSLEEIRGGALAAPVRMLPKG
jgi:hypothetical protein